MTTPNVYGGPDETFPNLTSPSGSDSDGSDGPPAQGEQVPVPVSPQQEGQPPGLAAGAAGAAGDGAGATPGAAQPGGVRPSQGPLPG